MAYTVTAPLVIAKTAEGADLYLYQSALVPADQSQDWIDRHVADGMIAETAAVAPLEGDETPAGNASHDDWVAYAVSQGMSQDEAEAMSRDDLRDLYR